MPAMAYARSWGVGVSETSIMSSGRGIRTLLIAPARILPQKNSEIRI